MKHRDTLIINHMRRHPEAKTADVAKLFNVGLTKVQLLRHVLEPINYKRAIARERRVTARELDAMVLKAVYDKCLVDSVLGRA